VTGHALTFNIDPGADEIDHDIDVPPYTQDRHFAASLDLIIRKAA